MKRSGDIGELRESERLYVEALVRDPERSHANALRAAGLPAHTKQGTILSRQRVLAYYTLLTDRAVAARIEAMTAAAKADAERAADRTMPSDEVLERLSDQARFDIADLLSVGPGGVRFDLAQAIARKATGQIKGLKIKPSQYGDEISVQLYDGQGALKLLGQYYGHFDGKERDKSLTFEEFLELLKRQEIPSSSPRERLAAAIASAHEEIRH